MMEIGDVVRDIFRALGIPEWEVIGMPVPLAPDDAKVSSPAAETLNCATGTESTMGCSGEIVDTGGNVRKRRRKIQQIAD